MSCQTLRTLGTRRSGRSFRSNRASRAGLSCRDRACLRDARRSGRSCGPLRADRADWPRRTITPGFPLRAGEAGGTLRAGRPFRSGGALRTHRTRLGRRNGCGTGCVGRASLTAKAYHHLTLLVLGLNVHDAGGGMIGETEGEASVGIRSRLMLLVERDRCLTRFAQSADNTQLATRDHRLIDQDVGQGGGHARDEDGPD